jgi:hypothetical protein
MESDGMDSAPANPQPQLESNPSTLNFKILQMEGIFPEGDLL